MATVERRYTPEDLLAISDRPVPDLVDGKLVERDAMGYTSSTIAAAIVTILGSFVRAARAGFLSGSDGGFQIFADDPERVRYPDAAFVRAERLPGGRPSRGHCRVVPDLVVEVVSPNDDAELLQTKLRDYRLAGVPLTWVVYPETREVQVIRADGTARYLATDDEVDGGAVLPGFRCRVAEFFE